MPNKLISMLMVPAAVAAVAGGTIFITHQVGAQSPQAAHQSADKPEPGDIPDASGKPDWQDKQDKQDTPDTRDNGQDGEIND